MPDWGLQPYRVSDSGLDIPEVYDRVNRFCYEYRDLDPRRGPMRTIVNPVHAFERSMLRLGDLQIPARFSSPTRGTGGQRREISCGHSREIAWPPRRSSGL